jgi:hypothetical protein
MLGLVGGSVVRMCEFGVFFLLLWMECWIFKLLGGLQSSCLFDFTCGGKREVSDNAIVTVDWPKSLWEADYTFHYPLPHCQSET